MTNQNKKNILFYTKLIYYFFLFFILTNNLLAKELFEYNMHYKSSTVLTETYEDYDAIYDYDNYRNEENTYQAYLEYKIYIEEQEKDLNLAHKEFDYELTN